MRIGSVLTSLLLGCTMAQAADLPLPVEAPVVDNSQAFNWSGLYLGLQGGYEWGDLQERGYVTATGAPASSRDYDAEGFVVGAHIGANTQWGMAVFGIEGDIEYSDVDGGFFDVGFGGTDLNVEWQGSVRGRLGVAFDRALLYATGGLAFADIRSIQSPAAGAPTEEFEDVEVGWTVGGGGEFAFNQHWSTRLEYRYTEFDEISYDSFVAFPGFSFETENQFHTVRGGVSYRF